MLLYEEEKQEPSDIYQVVENEDYTLQKETVSENAESYGIDNDEVIYYEETEEVLDNEYDIITDGEMVLLKEEEYAEYDSRYDIISDGNVTLIKEAYE